MAMMHLVPRGRPAIRRKPTLHSPSAKTPTIGTPFIGTTTETATIVNYAAIDISSSEEIDLVPEAPAYPRNVPDVMRVMVPPPPAYVFKDLEVKMLGPDYPSPDTSFEKNWEITHPPRVPPFPV